MATTEATTTDAGHRRVNPDHPIYAIMIVEAIRSLDEAEGSTEASISEYIKANFSGLSSGHDRLLPYYLYKLINNGEAEFVMGPHGRYLMGQAQDGDPEPHGKEDEETANAVEAQEEGSMNKLDIAEAPVCAEPTNADDVDATKVNDEGTEANLNDDNNAAAAQKQNWEDVLMKNRNSEDGEFIMMQISEDGFSNPNNEEESAPQLNLLPLNAAELVLNIAPVAPSLGETKGPENVEAEIVNLDEEQEGDDEGVPLSCEGDLVMELMPLPPTVSELLPKRRGRPPKRRWKRNLTGNSGATMAQDGEKVVLKKILPQHEHGAQKLVPARRERPPKRKCTEPTQLVDPDTLVINDDGVEAKDFEENQVNESTPMPKRRGRSPKRNPKTTDNSKAVVVHIEDDESNTSPLGTSGNVKFPFTEEGNDGSKPVIRRRGRPPKRKDDGDVEPLQLVVPSSLGANGNAKVPVSKKTTRKNDGGLEPIIPKRRGRTPKRKDYGDVEPLQLVVPLSLGANSNAKVPVSKKARRKTDDGLEPIPRRRGRPPKRKDDGDVEPLQSVVPPSLGANGNAKAPVSKKARRKKDDGLEPIPKRRGRPPIRKDDGDVEPLQMVVPSSLGANGNAKVPVSKKARRKKEDGLVPIPKRRGRPPKIKHDGNVEPLQLVVPLSLGANGNASM